MNLINQSLRATIFTRPLGGPTMNHQEKQKALSNFTSRLQGILNKTKAAIKDKKTDDFFSIDCEFKLLKQDFQKQSGKCVPHDQAMFQFGRYWLNSSPYSTSKTRLILPTGN